MPGGVTGAVRFWDNLLCFYGCTLPNHPGKRRMVHNLAYLGRATWGLPRLATRRGITYELDLRDVIPHSIFYLGQYERWETRWVEATVQPGWTVVDAGAHIGYYSLLCGRRVGSEGVVHAFEPCPPTYTRLLRNLELNGAANVRPHPLALADRPGRAAMVQAADSNTGWSYLQPGEAAPGATVEVSTLDLFVREQDLARLDFLKVDVEGSEWRFLAGAEQALARFRPRLMIEVNPQALERFGAGAEQVTQWLRERGYTLHRAGRRSLRPLEQLPRPGKYVNLIALPS